MSGEKNLQTLVREMKPYVNKGEYVFVSVNSIENIAREDVICEFKEAEGITLILEKNKADILQLNYAYVASWLTLKIHSSLEAVGLTALFSSALAKNNISCNVVAGYYHDHIFVDIKDTEKALTTLQNLSKSY